MHCRRTHISRLAAVARLSVYACLCVCVCNVCSSSRNHHLIYYYYRSSTLSKVFFSSFRSRWVVQCSEVACVFICVSRIGVDPTGIFLAIPFVCSRVALAVAANGAKHTHTGAHQPEMRDFVFVRLQATYAMAMTRGTVYICLCHAITP